MSDKSAIRSRWEVVWDGRVEVHRTEPDVVVFEIPDGPWMKVGRTYSFDFPDDSFPEAGEVRMRILQRREGV